MDDNKVIDLLLRLLEKVSGLEAKLDGFNGSHAALTEKVDKLEGRVDALEKEPGNKWNKLTTAILVGIGTLIAGGIVTAVIIGLSK
jgi:phage shock protein A